MSIDLRNLRKRSSCRRDGSPSPSSDVRTFVSSKASPSSGVLTSRLARIAGNVLEKWKNSLAKSSNSLSVTSPLENLVRKSL